MYITLLLIVRIISLPPGTKFVQPEEKSKTKA